MDEFTSFLIEEIQLQLDQIDEASSHEEVEDATENARRYLERLKAKLGGM